jgi:hypothetical protein
MQDRISQSCQNLLHRTAGPYIWVNRDQVTQETTSIHVRSSSNTDRKLNALRM